MSRRINLTIITLLLFIISGCGRGSAAGTPENGGEPSPGTNSGETDEIVQIGKAVRLTERPEGFRPDTSSEALAANGMYYAAWKLDHTAAGDDNPSGDDYTDAQIHLISYEAVSSDDAASRCAAWQAGAGQHYEIKNKLEQSIGGHTWQLIVYQINSADSPFTHGTSAFCAESSCAVFAELSCTDNYPNDPEAELSTFLELLSF